MLKRRDLLKQAGVFSLAPTIPAFLRTVSGASVLQQEKILVVVQLTGGNDGLNTIVPFRDDAYARNRTALRLDPKDLIKIDDQTGLHPAMQAWADLLEDSRLAIVQGAGYPDPNRSHDVSMAVWQTASTDAEDHRGSGWLGRALDLIPGSHDRPASLLVADQTTPSALRGRRSLSVTMNSLDEFQVEPAQLDLESHKSGSSIADFMQRSTLDAYATAERVQSIAQLSQASTNLNLSRQGSELARRLKVIADLIQADFGPRVYYCMQTGYDTHSRQLPDHAELLRVLTRSVKAFLDDMRASDLGERVLVLCFSEFGRQVQENASAGTDHGTAGPVFLAGDAVISGLHGRSPDLGQLIGNAPNHTVDFRRIYQSILIDWLQLPDPALTASPPMKLISGV